MNDTQSGGEAAALQGDFVEVANVADVPLGAARTMMVGERAVALYHTASGFFATDNTCPHRGGPLGEGDLIGDEIICPWHFWTFDVTTGANIGNPDCIVPTHEVRVEGDKILVKCSHPAAANESQATSQA